MPSYLSRPVVRALLLAAGPLAAQPVVAAPIPVTNADFESPLLAPQGATSNTIPGWSLFDPFGAVSSGFQFGVLNPSGSGGGVFGVNTGYTTNAAFSGRNVAYTFGPDLSSPPPPVETEFGIQQTLGATTVSANAKYRLTVAVGNEASYTDFLAIAGQDLTGFPGYRVQLLANGVVIAEDDNSLVIPDGSFGLSTVEFTSPDSGGPVGDVLGIRLINKNPPGGGPQGFEVDFDAVSLDFFQAPTADANGPYTFDAANLNIALDGTGSTDPDNDIASFDWQVGATSLTGATPSLGIVDSGLTSTDAPAVAVNLTVTDAEGLSDTASSSVVYVNAGPAVDSASGTENGDLSMTFDMQFSDADLIVNPLIASFEDLVLFELLFLGTDFLTGNLATDGLNWVETLDRLTLESIFGGPGTFTVDARVTDRAGAQATASFDITLTAANAPEPGTLVLLALSLAGLTLVRRRV